MRDRPKVGDKLFISGGDRNFKAQECVVHRVGRTYFYINSRNIPENYDRRFYISDWSYDKSCNTNYELHLKKSDHDSKLEIQRLSEKIANLFNWDKRRNLGAGKILAVAAILGIEIKEDAD